jgi:signal transduction histidine kinase
VLPTVEQHSIAELLNSIKGWRVNLSAVSSYEEALKAMDKRQYDVYLVYHQLPESNGIEFLRKTENLRIAIESSASLPVILVMSDLEPDFASKAIKSGAADCLAMNHLTIFRLRQAVENAYEKFLLRKSIYEHRINLEKTHRQLQHKAQEIHSFYFTLSHELKTPLTSAREFLALMLDGIAGKLSAEQLEYIKLAKDSCDNLAAIVTDLIDTSHLDDGNLFINQKTALIEGIIVNAIDAKQSQAKQKGISISANFEKNMHPVLIDVKRIKQVMMHLLDNAIKYSPEGGKVEIKASNYQDEPAEILVEIIDNGCGIEEQHLPYIFDRLYQVKCDLVNKDVGLGMGLNLCKELIHLHHGEIWVESIAEKGSVFSFTLQAISHSEKES